MVRAQVRGTGAMGMWPVSVEFFAVLSALYLGDRGAPEHSMCSLSISSATATKASMRELI